MGASGAPRAPPRAPAALAAAAVVATLVVALAAAPARALKNGLALTPPMGWLSWERYACTTDCAAFPGACIDEALYLRQASALVSGGYLAAGYDLVDIDDCWPAKNRSASGALVADPQRFPRGIKYLADRVHAMGLRLGIYLDVGTETCGGYPGFDVPTGPSPPASPRYEADVAQLLSWGIDSIKVDGCFAAPATMNVSYPRLGRALEGGASPVLYACSWPDYVRASGLPLQYALVAETCNVWRVYDDISASFESVAGIVHYFANNSRALAAAAGPGAWNDADMLVIGGTGLSPAQERLQMALWCVFASPLLMSNDLAAVSNESRAVLLNPEAVAVSQDPLGRPGTLVSPYAGPSTTAMVWARALAGGDVAVALVNLSTFGGAAVVSFGAADVGLPAGAPFAVRDIFARANLPAARNGTFSAHVESSSCLFLRLSKV